MEPEGTYLVWLDFKALGMSDEELERLIINKAGLWLDGGTMFGAGGSGFQRINIACPRSVLEQAMNKLEKAIKGANERKRACRAASSTFCDKPRCVNPAA